MKMPLKCFLGGVIALAILFSLFLIKTRDLVDLEFGWLFPAMEKYGGKVVCRERNWYVVYGFQEKSFNDFVNENGFHDKGYKGWEPFKEKKFLGVKKILSINGLESAFQQNLKLGNDGADEIAIFSDEARSQIILYYGVTHGM